MATTTETPVGEEDDVGRSDAEREQLERFLGNPREVWKNESDQEAMIEVAQSKRGSSMLGATINFMKGMIGAGVLSLPKGFAEAGLWLGIATFVALTLIVTFAMLTLFQCKREANRRSITKDQYRGPVASFQDIGGAAHPIGGLVTTVSVATLQLCFCTGYVIVMLANLNALLPWLSRPLAGACLLPALLMLSYIPFIRQLVFTSFFGLAVYLLGVMGVSYYYALPAIPQHYQETTPAIWRTMPLFASSVVYAIGGFNAAISCESTLKEPRRAVPMTGIVMVTLPGAVMLYGLVMYLAGYGNCGIVLDCLPQRSLATMGVRAALTLALMLTYPLGLSFGLEGLEGALFARLRKRQHMQLKMQAQREKAKRLRKEGRTAADEEELLASDEPESGARPVPETPAEAAKRWSCAAAVAVAAATRASLKKAVAENGLRQFVARCALRTALVSGTVLVAVCVPDFSMFTNFVGSFILPFLGFILPPFLYFRIAGRRGRGERPRAEPRTPCGRLVAGVKKALLVGALSGLVLFGCLFMVVGLYIAVITLLLNK
eukprot:TRINITY_DN6310_c0_g1_i1.p1 TRINITY_DN6310_c0_g1~~TRINITY_DN6310_c0_g1_i1.p1  ORF type:complete len:590 (-),score=118.73 TRINITY_DN6310_c0_g1_i1:9-1649(-)